MTSRLKACLNNQLADASELYLELSFLLDPKIGLLIRPMRSQAPALDSPFIAPPFEIRKADISAVQDSYLRSGCLSYHSMVICMSSYERVPRNLLWTPIV